jgi:superfamily I DNA and/or RNA helicase
VQRLLGSRRVVVIDEAGQASFCQVASLLAAIPDVRKVLVAGDKFQLGVNNERRHEFLRSGIFNY